MSWWSLSRELSAIEERFGFIKDRKIVRGLYKTGPATSSTTVFVVSLPRVAPSSSQTSGGIVLGAQLRIAVIQPLGSNGPWTEGRMYQDYMEPLRSVIEPCGWQFTEAMVGAEDDKQIAYALDCGWERAAF